jgi:DNA recombination protein RmuC
MALMFVPSESVYADLHDNFDDLFQKAYRARVVLVSPSLLMLAVQVIQQIQKDAKMREAADCIRKEVTHLLDDVGRMRDRVAKLERHFGQANDDIRQILISADKIEKRGSRIEELEFEGAAEPPVAAILPTPLRQLQAGE